MNAPDELTLVLPDGTRYEGKGQYDDDGKLKVELATCGHCGFTWNDALITSLTPVPSGRCPNEYSHVYEESNDQAASTAVRPKTPKARHDMPPSRDDIYPTYIEGSVTLSDGSATAFSIRPDLGWQQWGNITEKLGCTVDLMDALAQATFEHLRDDDDEDSEDE